MSDEQDSQWPEPNDGERADVNLGDGHTLTWSKYQGEIVGGIIRHTIPKTEQNPNGYCDGAFWLRGNAFSASHRPDSPRWDMTGTYEKPTLSPSFLCHCGDHGFVRDGAWQRA